MKTVREKSHVTRRGTMILDRRLLLRTVEARKHQNDAARCGKEEQAVDQKPYAQQKDFLK